MASTEKAPEFFNFARDTFDYWAEKDEKQVALWFVDDGGNEKKWTYKELSDASKRCACLLTERCGLRKGDVVMVMCDRRPEWWIAVLAIVRIGAVFVPAPVKTNSRLMRFRLDSSGCSHVVASPLAASVVDQVMSEMEMDACKVKHKILAGVEQITGWVNLRSESAKFPPEFRTENTKSSDSVACFFTSGSSGAAKLAQHSQASLFIANAIAGKDWLDLSPSDIFWHVTDLSWMKATLSSLALVFKAGAALFVHSLSSQDTTAMFRKCLHILTEYEITTFCAPPTGYRIMLQEDLTKVRPKALRRCLSSGEKANGEVLRKWQEAFGVSIAEGYGQTELGLAVANMVKTGHHKTGTMGTVCPGFQFEVVDEEQRPVKRGEMGELVCRIKPESCRPMALFSGYLNAPDRTSSVYRGDFYLTGDRVYQDDEGCYNYVGRTDDVINTVLGARVGPFEVESALLEHPAVVESAAVSSPDPELREVIKVFVVLSESFRNRDEKELATMLQNHVVSLIDESRKPEKVEFVKELPKTVTGKIQRALLRRQEWADAPQE